MKFSSKIISASSQSRSYRISIPVEISTNLGLKNDDVVLVKLDKEIFPSQIYSKNGYSILKIPADICKKYKLELGTKITVEIIMVNSILSKAVKSKNIIDRVRTFPKTTVKNRELAIIPYKEELILWPLARNARFIKVPRFFKNVYLIDVYGRKVTSFEMLFEIIGLYLGEGNKTNKFGITNSQPKILEHFIDFLEKFYNVKRELWECILIYRDREFNLKTEEKLKEFWKSRLKLRKFIKTDFDKVKERMSPYGTLHIRLTYDVGLVIFQEWLNLIDKTFENTKYIWALLRGIFAGEGWPELSRNNSLWSVSISSQDPRLQNLYKRLLEKVGVNIEFNGKYTRISGWKFFYVLAKNKAFFLNPSTNFLFLKGFLSHKKTQNILKYLSIFKQKGLQAKEVVRILKLKPKSRPKSRKILNNLVVEGFLKREGVGLSNDPFIYMLTKKGREFLNFIKEVKKDIRV